MRVPIKSRLSQATDLTGCYSSFIISTVSPDVALYVIGSYKLQARMRLRKSN
jgi:hypothetical protein